jgi:hypothetical protein
VLTPKVLSPAKGSKGSSTDVTELTKLSVSEVKACKQVETVQAEGQKDGKDKMEPRYQSGVLRTNCIDCLDRTNVAQYAYGLAALGHQLLSLGLSDTPKVDPNSSVADALMDMYQNMGDALALQYGGSAAHNTVSNLLHGNKYYLYADDLRYLSR